MTSSLKRNVINMATVIKKVVKSMSKHILNMRGSFIHLNHASGFFLYLK